MHEEFFCLKDVVIEVGVVDLKIPITFRHLSFEIPVCAHAHWDTTYECKSQRISMSDSTDKVCAAQYSMQNGH